MTEMKPSQNVQRQFSHFQEQQVDFDALHNQNNHDRHYGNNIIILRKSNGQPQLMLGPHWYIFIFAFLVFVILFILMIYSLRNIPNHTWLLVIIATSTVCSYSYLRVGLSYPGFAEPTTNVQLSNMPEMCQTCSVVRRQKVFHCPDCNVCIQGYDHHCPWIGKCVGSNNLCSFYFFLVMLFGNLVLCFACAISSGMLNGTKTNA